MDPKAGKEGGMNCKIGIDVYTLLLYKKWITSENLLYNTGNSPQYSGKEIPKR